MTVAAWISKQIVHFHSPDSGKYPDLEAFHLFQTSEAAEFHLCRRLSAHTLIQTHSHTHTGSSQRRRLHTLYFILAAAAGRRVCAQTWWTGRWNVPGRRPISVAPDTDVPPCDARTGFHWRKSRGSVRPKYSRQRQRRSRGAITGWKMLKIVGVWRCSRFMSGNVDIIRVYNGTHQETPAGFHHKTGFLFSWNSPKYPRISAS